MKFSNTCLLVGRDLVGDLVLLGVLLLLLLVMVVGLLQVLLLLLLLLLLLAPDVGLFSKTADEKLNVAITREMRI